MIEKIKLPSFEHTFAVDIKGDDTQTKYQGQFTYKRPNLHERSEIIKLKTRLNGELKNFDQDISAFNEMSAHLTLCIITSPEWWKESNCGRDLFDFNVIKEIYQECMRFEAEWTSKVWGEKKEDVIETTGTPSKGK